MTLPRQRLEELAISDAIEVDIDVACEDRRDAEEVQLEWFEEDEPPFSPESGDQYSVR